MKGVVDAELLNTENFLEMRAQVRSARFLTAITGAGISRASGLPVVAAAQGNREWEKLFDAEFRDGHPNEYFRIYERVLLFWRSALPNAAHRALARAGVWTITLNIDGLHRDAGAERLIEMHGNLRELRCARCALVCNSAMVHICNPPACPGCGAVLRPSITMQGEEVRHFSRAVDWVGRADLLLLIGTRLQARPANLLPNIARKRRVPVVTVNARAEWMVPHLLQPSDSAW